MHHVKPQFNGKDNDDGRKNADGDDDNDYDYDDDDENVDDGDYSKRGPNSMGVMMVMKAKKRRWRMSKSGMGWG